jgi:hypothetical protein
VRQAVYERLWAPLFRLDSPNANNVSAAWIWTHVSGWDLAALDVPGELGYIDGGSERW